jgi:hypothetical protein
MANIVLNDALGRIAEKIADGVNIQIIPLSAQDTDAVIKDAGPDLATVLGLAGTTEQVAGGWVRKTVTNGSLTLTVDDTGDLVKVIVPDQIWTGPTAPNDTVALLVAEDNGGADSADAVFTKHDFAVTADGNDVTADFDAAAGFWQSS